MDGNELLCSIDVLPLHPQPKRLEASTGHLTRVGNANCLTSVKCLGALCVPTMLYDTFMDWADLPFPSIQVLDELSSALACPKPRLIDTTFYHLATKFGRATSPAAVSKFLSHSVATHLRYCPDCLRSQPYYRLTWRFLSLLGCAEHHCHLLDHCGHCGQPIPLLTTPFRIGKCPMCNGTLSECFSEQLTDDQRRSTRTRTLDLEYLLSPPEQSAAPLHRSLGAEFSRMRTLKRVSQREVARTLSTNGTSIENIEIDYAKGGAPFRRYLAYADYLGTTLHDLLRSRQIPDDEVPSYRNSVAAHVETALMSLYSDNKSVTLAAISRRVGVEEDTLINMPQVMKIIGPIVPHVRRQREASCLYLRYRQAVQQMESSGQPFTLRALVHTLHTNTGQLFKHPCIAAHWNDVKPRLYEASRRERKQQAVERARLREVELAHRVKAAIVHLLSTDQTVTKAAVARTMNKTFSIFYLYPNLVKLFDVSLSELETVNNGIH